MSKKLFVKNKISFTLFKNNKTMKHFTNAKVKAFLLGVAIVFVTSLFFTSCNNGNKSEGGAATIVHDTVLLHVHDTIVLHDTVSSPAHRLVYPLTHSAQNPVKPISQ
jgi:hypothetical protein